MPFGMERSSQARSRGLHSLTLFAGLETAALEEIVHSARQVHRDRGEAFFRQGEPAVFFHLLLEGRVKLTRLTLKGHRIAVRLVGPGEPFGGVAALRRAAYPATAEALEASVALAWEGRTWRELLRRHPPLALNLLDLLARRLQRLQERYHEQVAERVERRVARALLRLAAWAGRRLEDGSVAIDLPLSRETLAELTGTTLYTVSRLLSRWEAQGLLQAGRERVILRDLQGLAALASDPEPPSL